MKTEIDIYGTIGADITAKGFRSQMPDSGPVRVCINSGGGHVGDAIAIYNRLMEHPGKVEVVVDGLAASAATLIMMAATTIVVRSNALVMVHRPWGAQAGDSDTMEAAAKVLDLTEDAMVDIYASRTRLSKARIRKLLAEETWLSAEEAVKLGFADRVVKAGKGSSQIAALYVAASVLDRTLPRYNARPALKADVDNATVDSILADAAAQGVTYGAGMARWVVEHHKGHAVAVFNEARRRHLADTTPSNH